MGEILAIVSGKGGTGKTSVCAGLATALAAQSRRVLCIDCDVGLRNLDISLGLSDSGALSFLDVSEGSYPLSGAAWHPAYPSLSFLTAPMNRPVEQVDKDAFRQMVHCARKDFDYILLDAPAGVDAGFRLAAAAADRFLLVTGSGPAAVRDAARVGEILENQGQKNVRLIVNRVDKAMLKAVRLTIDDVMDTAGLPLIGLVPDDYQVPLAAAFGRPLLKEAPRCPAAQAFWRIASRVQGFSQPIALK